MVEDSDDKYPGGHSAADRATSTERDFGVSNAEPGNV
jgi:hypothetical protein